MTAAGPKLVVIGASAGGFEALSTLLAALPAEISYAIGVVVHIPAQAPCLLAELLADKSQIVVKEAEDKEKMCLGYAYLAPPDYHLLIESDGYLSLSSEEPVLYSRPSIDVLFESAAAAAQSEVLGVVLTGANSDGARGLRAILDGGGSGWIQNPKNARVATMPEAAIRICPEALVVDIEEMAERLGGFAE